MSGWYPQGGRTTPWVAGSEGPGPRPLTHAPKPTAPRRSAASPRPLRSRMLRRRRRRRGAAERASRHDRRPDDRQPALHARGAERAGRRGDELQPVPRRPAALLPLASNVPHRAVPPQPRRAQQPRAIRLAVDGLQPDDLHVPGRCRLPHRLDRQGHERAGQGGPRAGPGLRRLARPGRRPGEHRHVRLHAQRQRARRALHRRVRDRRPRRASPRVHRRERRRPEPVHAHGLGPQPALGPLPEDPRSLRTAAGAGGRRHDVRRPLPLRPPTSPRARSNEPPPVATGSARSSRCSRSTAWSATWSTSSATSASSTTP